jgi:hypothetical protein
MERSRPTVVAENVLFAKSRCCYVRVGFEVLAATSVTGMLCHSLVEIDRRFRGAYCLHYRNDRHADGGSKHHRNAGRFVPDYGATFRKTAVLISVCCPA